MEDTHLAQTPCSLYFLGWVGVWEILYSVTFKYSDAFESECLHGGGVIRIDRKIYLLFPINYLLQDLSSYTRDRP